MCDKLKFFKIIYLIYFFSLEIKFFIYASEEIKNYF